MTINGIISRGQSVCDSANKVYKHLGIVKNIYRGDHRVIHKSCEFGYWKQRYNLTSRAVRLLISKKVVIHTGMDYLHLYLFGIFWAAFTVFIYFWQILYVGIFLVIAFLFSSTNVLQLKLDILGLFQLEYRVIRNASSLHHWDLIYENFSDMTRALRALIQRLAFGAAVDPSNPGVEDPSYPNNMARWGDF